MILLATVLVFSAQVVAGSPQAPIRDRVPPPRTGTAVIKGRVVDGITGSAIARARVMLQGPGAAAPVVTGADGGFTFSGLPAGPVTVMVQKPTYLQGRYPAPGRTMRSNMRPLMLRNGQVLADIVVPLFHGASISGRVFDANGDPIDFAQVSLLRLPRGGIGKPATRESTQTNDLGEFRLGRLEAGTYLVQVTPRRMEEMPFPANAPPPQTTPLLLPLPTFYPGALAIDQAQPIVLDRAQAVSGIDVVLAEGIPGVISGGIVMADGQPLPANTWPNVMIRRRVSDTLNSFDFSQGTTTRPDGSFRATLPPGDYTIEARVMPRNSGPTRPEDEQVGSARVTVVSGGEESLTIVAGPGASATGRVIFEGTTPVPPSPGRIRIPMYSEMGMCRSGEAIVGADWSFRVEGLIGTCSSPPMDMYGRWMLKAIVVNGENIMDAPFTFETGQKLRNVQVVVTDRRSSMTFQVSDENGQPTREYVVVAYPADKERWPQAVRPYVPPPTPILDGTASTGLPGPAPSALSRPQMLSGLRPGDYYVVALDDMEPEDVRDASVLERLRSSATRVTLAEGATIDVALRRVNFTAIVRQK